MDDRPRTTVKKQRDEQDEHTVVERHDPLLGQLIASRYRIAEKIAAGGFGAIYRAHDLPKKRDVAVKVLHSSHAADPNVIARFRREGTTLSNLRARNTVTTYELGETADGILYIVMELLRGESLHERLRKRGSLPWRDAVAIARAVCDALAEAHELGIIHRDLKPANIHLEAGDFVKVLDFGIAKIRRGAGLDDGGDLTNAGQMIGTIDYMAPEQILGAACDGRTDMFTLGIVTYEMIAGRRPFADSTTPTSMLAALLTQVPPPISRWTPVPPALDEVVARCLRREAHERFATVHELATALDGVLLASDDATATRPIDLAPTRVAEPISFDDEATTFAPEPRRGRPANTLESAVPPAPRSSHVTIPEAAPRSSHVTIPEVAPREPTPPPQRLRPPTPAPRTPPPALGPPPRTPPAAHAPAPPAPVAADTSGWQRAPRPSEPPPWQGGAAPHPSVTPPGVAPYPHVPTPAGISPIPPTPAPRSYDASRDAVVGRVVWILAIVVVVILGIGVYTAIR